MDLADDDEAIGVNPNGLGHATAILQNARGIIVDVVAEIERLVRGRTHAAGAAGDECPDAKMTCEFNRVDVELSVGFRRES